MDCSVNHMDHSHLNSSKGDAKPLNNCKTMASTLDGLPWIAKFKAMCLTGMDSASSLINLMTFFIRNVRPTVNECQTKPLRADKLKGFISESLLLFMYNYKSQEETQDRTIYMDLMSDLLAMYIDLELKASKRTCEYHERISGRLASYLYVYLENSPEHLMDTILKIRFMSSTYYQIINPLLTKIFRVIPEHPSTSLMYIRYFLVYRIWKRITKDSNIKNEINTRALLSLESYPTSLPQYVTDHVLPKVPNNQKISTRLLLTQHIELEKTCEAFIKFCRNSRVSKDSEEVDQTQLSDNTEFLERYNQPEENSLCKVKLLLRENTDKNILSNNSSNNNNNNNTNHNNNSYNQTKDSINSFNIKFNPDNKIINIKTMSRKIPKINSEVVLIDLTSEDSKGRIIRQKKKKQLSWIQKILKRQSTTSDSYEDAKNSKEDKLHLEDTLSLQSLLITSDKNSLLDEEMKIQSSQFISDEVSENNLTKSKDDEEKRHLIFAEIGAKQDEAMACKENIESQSFKNVEVPKVECEEFSEDFEENEVQAPVFINDEVEVTTTKLSVFEEKNIKDINVLENEYLDETSTKDEVEQVNGLNCKTNLSNVSVNIDMNVHSRDTVLQFNLKSPEPARKEDISKIHEVEFNDHIDGLSLLASVSQRVSHLNTPSTDGNKTRELIKVKDYDSLRTCSEINEDQRSRVYENQSSAEMNGFVSVYTDDDIDRVALNVEVSSTEDLSNHYTSSGHHGGRLENSCILNELPIELTSTSVQVESTVPSDKDETNVILNGETIVLLQKSPNSNLYIINKAVENKDHSNEEEAMNLSEKNLMHEKVKDENYSREIYDPMYRIPQSFSSQSPYELAQEARRNSKIKVDPTTENIACLDSKMTVKNNSDINNPERCRIKQEFNSLPNHIANSAYGNQVCSQDLDPHALHIPSSNSLSGMYHPNYTPGDLYISYRQNCTSVACGLPVNHPGPPLHSRANSQRCSCLNCAYGIVTRCNQYIIPASEATATSKIDGSYYLPISESPVIQECSRQTAHETIEHQMYDNKLFCKIEADLDQNESQRKIYQSESNNKLPLKKRFKSMVPMDFKTPIKKENVVNNFIGSPTMISIAALESRDPIDASSKSITNIYSPDIIRGNYEKDLIDNYYNYTKERKRKRPDVIYSTDNSNGLKRTNEQIVRSPKKVKQLKSPKKSAAKKTRSSQRKIPKINYSYMDDEIECSPSGETKRKRKKLSR